MFRVPCSAFIEARGFTLIEMLVVIAVIGILAAIFLSQAGFSGEAKTRKRVEAELAQIQTVIDSYKAKRGHYPPDNNDPDKLATNPLYYELVGTIATNNPAGEPVFIIFGRTDANNTDFTVRPIDVKNAFGLDGFINCNDKADDAQNFHRNLRDSQVGTNNNVKILGVAIKGFSPWHYNSSKPVHNPESYDLWVEVDIGGKTKTFGNWKHD